jgi:voltage-gated sodium channel
MFSMNMKDEDAVEESPSMVYSRVPLHCRKGGCCCRWCFICCYGPVAQYCEGIEAHPLFEGLVTVAIVLAGALVGLQTSYKWPILDTIDTITTIVFVLECLIKIVARGAQPFDFFDSGWNRFDFFVIAGGQLPNAFALIGIDVGGLESIAILRLLRLLRALKLLKSVPQLQIIVLALVRGVSSMGYISLMIVLVFYVFAITAMIFFAENDPWRFGTLHNAMITLFQCATLDDWTDVMYTNMLGCDQYAYPMTSGHSSNGRKDGGGGPLGGACSAPFAFGWFAALFFVGFVVLGSLVLLTLFVGTVNISMEEAKASLSSKAQEENILHRVSVRHQVSQLHMDSYLELFRIMDVGKSGTLRRDELQPFLSAINPNFSTADLESVFTLVILRDIIFFKIHNKLQPKGICLLSHYS